MAIHMSYYTPLVGFASSARKPPPALADFPLMKEFQSSGQFWLPEIPDQPLWGKLHYVPGDVTTITLEGEINSNGYASNMSIPELHGRLFNGAPCVLRELWGDVESFFSRDRFCRTNLNSPLFLFGLDSGEAAADRFAMSAVRFSHLDEWFDPPLSLAYQEGSLEEYLVRFEPDRNEARAEFEEAPFKLQVFCSRTIPSGPNSGRMEFVFAYKLMIVPDVPQSLGWHMRVAALVRELFMLLIGSGVYTLEMKVFPVSPREGEVHVFPTVAVPMLIRLEPVYFYSRHRKVKHVFPRLFDNWFREQGRLAVVRHTVSDLLTVDGISPEAVFTRVVQTMEHFHGIVATDEGRYVPRAVWRRFVRWLNIQFPEFWTEAEPAERDELLKHKEALIGRIGGVNSFSFRTRIRALFDAVPGRELMPLLGNPREIPEYLDALIPRIEATRHYLTHFNLDQKDLAFPADQLEEPTLQCWSVLMYALARLLGFDEELAGDLALAARRTLFIVGTKTPL